MIPGLPREYHAASAARTLDRVTRRETSTLTRTKGPVPCVFCHAAWLDFEKRIPAVSFSKADGMLMIDCACCNSRRTISRRERP
jgi:hypothetical protein